MAGLRRGAEIETIEQRRAHSVAAVRAGAHWRLIAACIFSSAILSTIHMRVMPTFRFVHRSL